MKRKIVKHGANTLTISLPRKWVKKHEIEQGQELDITERGSTLIIGEKYKPASRGIDIDLSGTENMLARTIAGIYKSGYDSVKINYKTPKELELIQNTVYRYCHVYEIINISQNTIEIKAISLLNPDNFPQMLEKSAQATLSIARETLVAIKKQDYNELSNLILKDKIVDRYCAFGSRIINKGYAIDGAGPYYLILDETEIAADILKFISNEVIDKKLKLQDSLLNFFSLVLQIMESQYDLLFDFSVDKVKEFGKLELVIRDEIDVLCNNEKKNIKILAYLVNLFETIFEMKSAIITLQLGQKGRLASD